MKFEHKNHRQPDPVKVLRLPYLFVLIFVLFFIVPAKSARRAAKLSADYMLKKNIFYKDKTDLNPYEKERCYLDLYLPNTKNKFPVMVWFHGGSLHRCSKDDIFTWNLAATFARQGVGIAVVNYRLSPRAKYPAYIEDAAAAVSWVKNNITRFNGDPQGIFISGHSAGGYLAYMLGMDKTYLKNQGIKLTDIAGIIPISGQTFTHYTVRKEKGVPDYKVRPIIDRASPCYHARKDSPPILAVCGDMDPGDRIEENHYMISLLKKLGHSDATYREIKNRNHWDLVLKIPTPDDPLRNEIIKFIFKKLNMKIRKF